jgi:hypothetical protein
MPEGCSTWPSFWLLGEKSWPEGGEVDIVEGVNNQPNNQMTLHTASVCDFTNFAPDEAATFGSHKNCLSPDGDNSGCGSVMKNKRNSFGPGFNAQGGGVYATLWNDEGLKIWFFTRSAIPADITSSKPDPTTWGKPDMNRPFGAHCGKERFSKMKFIINTALCGDFAAVPALFNGVAKCPGKCEDFVRNNPGAFTNAFWSINSIKVFQASGAANNGQESTTGAPATGITSGKKDQSSPAAVSNPGSIVTSAAPDNLGADRVVPVVSKKTAASVHSSRSCTKY